MNILLITPKIPYPLTEGGKISQFATIDYLRKKHSVILVLATYSSEDENNLIVLKRLWPEVTIEKIQMWNTQPQIQEKFFQKPEKRILFILKQMWCSAKKFAKKLLQKDKNQHNQSLEIDSPWVVQIAAVKDRKFINELLNIINRNQFDIIQIDFLEYVDLALVLPKEIKKVFVHHEIKYARLATTFKTFSASSTPFNNYIIDFVKSQEINLLKLYNGVFVFSDDDRAKLAGFIPEKNLFVTPFPVLDSSFRDISPNLLQIRKLVFVGAEGHEPNKDAVEWYINEIGIEVKKRLDLTLHIIGKWSKETIEKYKGNDLVYFPGFIEDLISYCENSIMVVPVRIGSGIRTKILYAMAQGVPVVSASIGCEGIDVIDKTDLLIANNPQEFAEAIHSIVTDSSLACKLAINAQKIIRMKYSQQVAGELRLHHLNELINKR